MKKPASEPDHKPATDSQSGHQSHRLTEPIRDGSALPDPDRDYAFYLINTLLYTADARPMRPIQLWDECQPPKDTMH